MSFVVTCAKSARVSTVIVPFYSRPQHKVIVPRSFNRSRLPAVNRRLLCLRVRGLCANAEKDHPSVAANVLSERMALFSGHSRSSRRGAKRKAVTKRSWTVSFICVADRYQSRIPSSTDKQVLFHAGLGMKKIKLDLEDDEHDVLEKITCGDKGDDGEIKGFPQLKESGGFEIMYCVSGCKKVGRKLTSQIYLALIRKGH